MILVESVTRYMNRHVVSGIYHVNEKLRKITKGELEDRKDSDFVLFLYEYDDQEELRNTINTLRYVQSHSSAYLDDKLRVPLSFSLGYEMAEKPTDYKLMLKRADENKRERENK